MKPTITNFDLENAFKALDEIEYPAGVGKIRPNCVDLQETFTKKHKTDALIESYYDVNSAAELEEAQEDRAADIAKAKLARIEKIVDLDAETEEDILPSYIGKYIMQCPQCMTLFYKNVEDIVYSEADPTEQTVNVGEVCQHCGNTDGYTIIGKVGAAEPAAEPAVAEVENTEVAETESNELADEESSKLDTVELETEVSGDEEKPVEDAAVDGPEESAAEEEIKKDESVMTERNKNLLQEGLLEESPELAVTDAAIDKLLNSKEFTTPITDAEVQSYFESVKAKPAQKVNLAIAEDLDDTALNNHISKFLTDIYSNVDNFTTTDCEINDNKLCAKGNIKFNSGKIKVTVFEFCPDEDGKLVCCNKDITEYPIGSLSCSLDPNKCIKPENFEYSFTIDENLVEGCTKKN